MIATVQRSRNAFLASALFFCFVEPMQWSFPGVSGSQCEPVRIPLCQSMPYNRTRMPNLLHHSTQENAILAAEQFEVLAKTRCSDALVFFLCALYAPICAVDFQNEAVPPCRSVCERARAGCEPLMNRYNISWPPELECDELPQYDRGVCVTPEAIVSEGNNTHNQLSTPSVKSGESFCRCPNDPKLTRKEYLKKRYDYVIEAKIKSIDVLGDLTFTHVHVERVIKQSKVKIQTDHLEYLWTISACACPRLTSQMKYIILGYEDPTHHRLLYREGTLAIPVKGAFIRKIQKWEQSLQKKLGGPKKKNNKEDPNENSNGKKKDKGKKTKKSTSDKRPKNKKRDKSKKHRKTQDS